MKIVTFSFATLLLLSAAAGAQDAKDQPQSTGPQTQQQTKQDTTQDNGKGWRKIHVKVSGASVGGFYSHFSGPVVSPLWPYGFYPYSFYPYGFAYSGLFFDPFYGPYYPSYFSGFRYGFDKGEVKLSADPKNAEVYVDGAYAGTVDHLKEIWLDPGAYDLSISAPDRTTFTQRIYVLSGKELKIKAKLDPKTASQQPKDSREKDQR